MADSAELPDPTRLRSWLSEHVPGFQGPVTPEALRGGQSNPTFRLRSSCGDLVLRRKPVGQLLPSAHAVEREYRVLRALVHSAVPVPVAHGLCDDPGVIGSVFYVMDYVPGRIFEDSRMPGVSRAERSELFDAMNQVISALHTIDPAAVDLADFGRTGKYIERQVARWKKQYYASITDPIDEMERLIEWLEARIPEDHSARIVHGDFKVDNIVFHPVESRIVALLDWELATIGDPLADFAFHLMAWHLEPDLFRGWAGEDLADLGIPSERDYAAAYERRTGTKTISDWRFYLVFSMFRLAAILQGIAKRVESGNASDPGASRVAHQARPVAARAWRLASST